MKTHGDEWKCGYAQAQITPRRDETVMMCGYGHDRSAKGALAPLEAQALALTDRRGRTALILSADILAFDRSMAERLRRVLRERHGLAPEAVLLAASHTHWGPGTLLRVNFAVGGPNPWYVQRLEEILLDLAGRALADRRSARLSYGAAELRLGRNRRLPNEKGEILFQINPDGSYDMHTPVIHVQWRRAVRDRIGELVLVGHACHPTSSGRIDKWWPDYPGAMRRRIQKKLGPKARGMFMMGCGADAKVSHVDPASKQEIFSGSPEWSRVAGCKLADGALRLLASAQLTALPAELRCKLASGKLSFGKPISQADLSDLATLPQQDFQSFWARQMLAYNPLDRGFRYDVQCWRLGEKLTLIALEGEVCSPLGPLARSLAKTPLAMTVAYANGSTGYIPTSRIVREGGYEGFSSHRAYFLPAPFTPRVEQEFRRIVKQAII